MKLKYWIKKFSKYKIGYFAFALIIVIVIVGGFSYAIFTTSNESKGALNIVTGNLYPNIESEGLDSDNEISLGPNKDKTISVKISNVNSIVVKSNLYYSASDLENLNIGYISDSDNASNIVLTKHGDSEDNKVVNIRMVNMGSSNIIIKFASSVSLLNSSIDVPTDWQPLTKFNEVVTEVNPYVEAVYRYNQDETDTANYCVTGEEETCKSISFNKATTYDNGTIIKYRVKDDTSLYFYVLHDDGETITLQQRDNTLNSVSWNENVTLGPVSLLEQIRLETEYWDNVEEQVYNLNEDTLCSTYSKNPTCSIGYTINNERTKARIISLKEVIAQCLKNTDDDNCPIYMSNYLKNSTDSDGTDNSESSGYWTSTIPGVGGSDAYVMLPTGKAGTTSISDSTMGARAVIVIKK